MTEHNIHLNLQVEFSNLMKQTEYKQYKYRFVIYVVFLINSFTNSIPTNTFSATATLVTDLFGISSTITAFNYLFFPISAALTAPIINWTLTKLGIRISYYIAAFLMIPGVWLRTTLSTNNPYLCLIGSFLISVGSNYMLNSASKLITHWFRKQVKSIITFMAIVINLISASIGLFIPGLLLNSQSTQENYINFLRLQAIMVTVPFILLVIVIKQKPPTPPSKGAEAEHETNKEKYTNILKKLFFNKNFILCALAMSLSFGLMTSYLSVISKCLKGLGYLQGSTVISKIVIAATIGGLVGNVVFSETIKRTKKYKVVAIIEQLCFFFGSMMLNIGLIDGVDETWKLGLLSLLVGAAYNASPSVFIVFGSQVAFPVDQASVAGYILGISHFVGFGLGLIFLPFVNETRSNSIAVFMVLQGLALLGVIVSLFIVEDLRFDRFQRGVLAKQQEHIEQKLI